MPDHLIRLRRGWEPCGATAGQPPRLFALPRPGFPEGPGAVTTLCRWFRSPPIDPACETLWLRLDAVPGLIFVALNGVEIAHDPFRELPLTIPLGNDLPARSQLILGVGLLPDAERPPAGFAWGDVALVVRRSVPD